MGTTLQNGVYLPNEGERNCYAGLKTNWEILDQKVADVTALQQAVAGALHREIVESLPTTDIDPNTIYMILSGTSATENVYNEFMYVNNAWELIGTSATDLTNYYTKGEVDGLLLLKANASDLTSHTGDTTIHVTSADKSKWNTVALIKQLRLVNTQVGSATTIAFANIDDTNGIKVGDKCMDLDAKMFEITAVDTTNQTVTVSSALIDLALDANVVHNTGNETVAGEKTFTDYSFGNSGYGFVGQGNRTSYILPEFTAGSSGLSIVTPDFNKSVKIGVWITDENTGKKVLNTTAGYLQFSTGSWNNVNTVSITPLNTINSNLGTSVNSWSKIYGTEYYYGSNSVEFSTKFVTTDTAQTISGNKTFSSNVNVYNSDSATDTANIVLKNSKAERGSTTNIGEQNISFVDKNNNQLGNIKCITNSAGVSNMYITCNASGSDVGVRLSRAPTATYFRATTNNDCKLGTTDVRWSDVQTYKVNNLEPSSLSLPSGNDSDKIDISSYITDLSGTPNSYTPPANGYLTFTFSNGSRVQIYTISGGGVSSNWVSGSSAGIIRGFIPVLKNSVLRIVINATTMDSFYFIPCQGNI